MAIPAGAPSRSSSPLLGSRHLALRHCHQRGIAHRDVKPENVLVLGSPATWGKGLPDAGIIKLCDFGLCADIQGGHELTDFVGSPGFFAPELFCEASYRGDLADAWSLGSVCRWRGVRPRPQDGRVIDRAGDFEHHTTHWLHTALRRPLGSVVLSASSDARLRLVSAPYDA